MNFGHALGIDKTDNSREACRCPDSRSVQYRLGQVQQLRSRRQRERNLEIRFTPLIIQNVDIHPNEELCPEQIAG